MKRTTKYLAFLISLLAFNNIIILTPPTPTIFYFGLISFSILLIILNSKHEINLLTALLIFLCFFSLQINSIPDYFRPYQRLTIFILMLALISPLIHGSQINYFKINCLRFTNKLIFGLILFSFFAKISGVYAGLDFANHFGGFALSSMTLAPFAALTLILSVFGLLTKKTSKSQSIFFVIMFISSISVLILSASRIAFVGAIVSILYILKSFFKNRFSKLFRILFYFSLIFALTFPIWDSFADDLLFKINIRSDQGTIFGSREELWEFRADEFISSPLFGIGFSNSLYGAINFETGTVEPGTSWGVLLSMLGFSGFSVFLLILINAVKINMKRINSGNIISGFLLNSILLFFSIHWIAEGYMLAANSFIFFYAWLVLGVSSIKNYNFKLPLL